MTPPTREMTFVLTDSSTSLSAQGISEPRALPGKGVEAVAKAPMERGMDDAMMENERGQDQG